MRIIIDSRVSVEDAPAELLDQFIADNTFRNPEYASTKRRLELRGREKGAGYARWVERWLKENVEEDVTLWIQTNPFEVSLPRGYLPAVIAKAREAKIEFEIDDRTVCPAVGYPEAPGRLDSFQQEALSELLRYPSGVLQAPTGSGKTAIMLAAIHKLRTTGLITVHTEELLKQTRDRCEQFLGIKAGIIQGSKWKLEPVTVAMSQTLDRRDLTQLKELFGCVFVDECHHAPAATWSRILNQLPSRYRYGVSATPKRKDGFTFLIWRLIGSITAKIGVQAAVDANRIIRPDIEIVPTPWHYHLQNTDQWPLMLNAMCADPERNAFLVDQIRRRLDAGRSILVLTDRVFHAKTLGELMPPCLHTVVLVGEMSTAERELAMARIRTGAAITIATLSLMGEGIDVPGWDTVFLATPIAGGGRTLQAIGRCMRAREGKDRALVVDFVDHMVTGSRVHKNFQGAWVTTRYWPLAEAAKKRQQEYKRLED